MAWLYRFKVVLGFNLYRYKGNTKGRSVAKKSKKSVTKEETRKGFPSEDNPLPLIEHLRELRKRVCISLGVLAAFFLVFWGFSHHVIRFIETPIRPFVDQLQFDTLTDPFFTHLKASFFAALFVSFPVVLGQLWLFISPALYKKEKGVAWPFILLSFPLFVGGGAFNYWLVFPFAVDFLVGFDPELIPSLRVGDYLSFTARMIFVFGLVFELPLISLLLTRAGFITPQFLARNRRYAIVIVFIVAAILTPPDILTQLLLAGPLVVLYEVSVIVSRLAKPKKVT